MPRKTQSATRHGSPERLANFRAQGAKDTRRSHAPRATTRMPSGTSTLGTEPIPRLTVDLARTFVRIIMAGVPADQALVYCAPHVQSADGQAVAVQAWANDPLMAAAVVAFNGAEWHCLDADKRIELALDKHAAELAYFLYAHSFEHAAGDELKKLSDAREALVELTKGEGEPDGPWAQMVKDLMAGTIGTALGPPTLATIPTTKES